MNYDENETISTSFRWKYVIFVEFRRFFHRRNQYRPSVFISFSIFMAFSKSPSIRIFCFSVLFSEEHPLDIRIYYLVWHLHLLHCRDIVEPFGATSKNGFRSISRSFRSIGRSFRSSRRSFRSVLYVSFQLKASFNSVRITLFFNCWYAPTIIKNLTRKCKISKCFCKSTPLLLKNNYLFAN